MKLSFSNIAWSYEQRLLVYAMLADFGFTGLEIAPGIFFHGANNPFVPSNKIANLAINEITNYGLKLVSMQSLLFGIEEVALFEGSRKRDNLETHMYRAIELAGKYEIPNMVFGSPSQRRIPESMEYEEAKIISADFFRRLGDEALQAQTVISLEPNPRAYGTNFLNTLDEAQEFVEYIDHSAIKLTLDLGAMHINNHFDKLVARIAKVEKQISHVHVSEPMLAPAATDYNQLIDLMIGLMNINYNRAISIEMKCPKNGINDIKNSLRHLKRAVTTASQ